MSLQRTALGRSRSKGALPPSALRLPPPRSPRGRRLGEKHPQPPAQSVGVVPQRQGCGLRPDILTRSVLAAGGGCAPLRLPVSPLTLFHSVPGQGHRNGKGSRFNGGDPPAGWGGNRSFLTPCSDPHAHGMGVGCAGRRPELPAPLPRGERPPSRWREGRGDGWCNDRREAQGEARRARP